MENETETQKVVLNPRMIRTIKIAAIAAGAVVGLTVVGIVLYKAGMLSNAEVVEEVIETTANVVPVI